MVRLGLRLAAIFEQEHFAGAVGKIEADGAIAADVIGRYTAARAPAVDLMDAQMIAHIKLPPGLDENRATRLVREKDFQSRPFVFHVSDRRFRFEGCIIQTF